MSASPSMPLAASGRCNAEPPRQLRTAAEFPGSGLLHPVPIAALAMLAANDHLLKAWWPGRVTGKLSDVAGMVFFPFLLQAAWEVLARTPPSRRVLLVAAAATGVVFALVNTWAPADAVYRLALAALQWPAHAAAALAAGDALPGLAKISHVADVEDLVALPGVIVAVMSGRSRE